MRKVAVPVMVLCASSRVFADDFFALAASGTPKQIEAAIKAGAKLDAKDSDGGTPLMFATSTNADPAVIELLLRAAAKIDDRDISGGTALMSAAANNAVTGVTAALLKAKARIKDNNDWTPLMYAAAFNQNPEVISALLKAGADPRAKAKDGTTALSLAEGNQALKGTQQLKDLQKAAK